eukprot:m.172203 g.172203  ORF g.172203 m.172203 type:complete len:55 (+) comp15363_c0_seq6:65-229(+)
MYYTIPLGYKKASLTISYGVSLVGFNVEDFLTSPTRCITLCLTLSEVMLGWEDG